MTELSTKELGTAGPSTPPGQQRLKGLLLVGMVLVACNIPLDIPEFTTNWEFVGVDETITTQGLLPDAVTLEGEVFRVDSIVSSRTVTIGEVCELCTCFSGPIPEVSITPQDFSLPLPGGLAKATLVDGSASLVLHNQMGFDLLNDGKGNQGFIEVELRDRVFGDVFSTIRIEEPFPTDDSLSLSFDLTGLELNPFLVASVRGTTPGSACDSIQLDPLDGIEANVRLKDVAATAVNIVLSDQAIRFPLTDIELPDAVSERLRPGEARVVLEVELVTSVETTVEVLLSAATVAEDLFTERAALFTPIPIEPGSLENPTVLRRLFLLNLESVENQPQLLIATRNRVVGNRAVLIRGGEEVKFKATIRAEIPSK